MKWNCQSHIIICNSYLIKICMVWCVFLQVNVAILSWPLFKCKECSWKSIFINTNIYFIWDYSWISKHIWCWIKELFFWKSGINKGNALSYSPFLIWPLHLNKNNPKNLCSCNVYFFHVVTLTYMCIVAYVCILYMRTNIINKQVKLHQVIQW